MESILTGIFFILAALSSIVGLALYGPILNTSDFLFHAQANYNQIIVGAINELILVVTASGTAIMLYPFLKKYHESFGMAYICFRLLEVLFIMIGIISVLTVLSISRLYNNGSINDQSNAFHLGLTFIEMHKWTFMLGPNFMLAINTFVYSFVFYQTQLIPRKLSGLGLMASFMIMLAALLEMFGIIQQISLWGIILALPIASYEMTLAVWLMIKGLKPYTREFN
jgi:hypothetical protein